MSRKVFVLLTVLALGLSLVATSASASSDRSTHARSEHQRIVDFWTPDRVSKAVPRDFVFSVPLAKPDNPGKPGGGNGGGSTVTGSSWNSGGAVLQTTGKILFAMGGSYYVCSGSVATESVSGRSVVSSAGHCVFDESSGEFATNWMFIPEYDSAPAALDTQGSFCEETVWGCWTASSLVVHDGYASAGGFNDQAVLYDWGFAVVGTGGHLDTHLDATVGSQGLSFDSVELGDEVSAFGYPAAQKYKGNDLVYCQGPVSTDPLNSDLTYRIACNMTGGSSGGPWFSPFTGSNGTGTQMSVNSYGYRGDSSMYGPVFNSNTEATWSAALTTNSNTVVGG